MRSECEHFERQWRWSVQCLNRNAQQYHAERKHSHHVRGGLYNATTATLLHATIASNSATSGGGLYSTGTTTLKSTLLNANTGGNCSGTVGSSGKQSR